VYINWEDQIFNIIDGNMSVNCNNYVEYITLCR